MASRSVLRIAEVLDCDERTAAVYLAEDRFTKGYKSSIEWFPSMSDVAEYVKTVIDTPWWQQRCDIQSINLHDGRGSKSAMYERDINRMTLPKWARYDVTILHEMAHVVCDPWVNHGPAFANNFLDMLRTFIGDQAKLGMLKCYDLYDVDYMAYDCKSCHKAIGLNERHPGLCFMCSGRRISNIL